jgi:two-component system, OmpR family, sensor histidine kinase ChvG
MIRPRFPVLPGRPSRIGLRILAFNLLVLFLPVAGILYLDVYERELLAAQERGMVQQARIVAAALAGDRDLATTAPALLQDVARRSDARIRVVAPDGRIVGDTAALAPGPTEPPEPTYLATVDGRSPGLYRAGAWIAQRARRVWEWSRGLVPVSGSAQAMPGSGIPPEVRAALGGRYGAATRPTPGQRSMTLHTALPIADGNGIAGAVVVSQSTYRILQALYGVRLRVFQVVVAAVVLAALLSGLMAATVVRPLVRLRRSAMAIAERRGALPARFRGSERHDEIGDLARALEELTRRLDDHARQVESMAADVSHELKNPLTSIRTAAEMIAVAEDPAERRRFLGMLTRDVDRLERLVSGVQEIARIDAQLAQEPPATTELRSLLVQVVQGARLASGPPIALHVPPRAEPCPVLGSADRLVQVFENLIRNARSFSPAHGTIDVALARETGWCTVSVSDRGPGIPVEHLDRIFHRFFSYRPQGGPARDHAGLGLPIARAIVSGYGGTIEAQNRDGGGACFTVRLKADAIGTVRLKPDAIGAGRVQSPDGVRGHSS